MARRCSVLHRRHDRRWSELAHKRRWTAEEAQAVFDAQAESGKTVAAFARQHGLPLPRLYDWRRKLTRGGGAGGIAPRFLPVRVVPAAGRTAAEPAEIEIVLGSGRRIRISESFDPMALARVIEVLERPTC